jgi:hypothetical protein
MSHKEKDHGKNNFDKNKNVEDQNEKRLDQLINLVDNHTRTERHLEQHSDIARPEAVLHSLDIQKEREEEIDNLKNVIVYGKHVNVDESDNLLRNYVYTDEYLENNANHMEKKTLERTKEKQEHRNDQYNIISD